MRFVYVTCLVLTVGTCAAEDPASARNDIHWGGIVFRPSGFFDVIAEQRSATTGDTVNLRFASIPLSENGRSETLWSLSHSRLAMHGERVLGQGTFTGYLEADFLTPHGERPWRWRQYWGEYRQGKWGVMAGRGWSLLRPNRTGLFSETALMNTMVIEPAYHVGLIGIRRSQLRITRDLTVNTKAALEWESGGSYLFKLARDRERAHLESTLFAGTRGRRGISIAHVLKMSAKIHWVGQHFVARGGGPEALGILPLRVSMWSLLEGLEAPVSNSLTLFGYAGIVHGSKAGGSANHSEAQWTAGAHRRVHHDSYGTLFISAQFSQIARQVWDGRSGHMNYWMTSLRFVYPQPE
jgi:hypothetical protein